jgi:DNA-binding NtrC family response regulator
VHATVGAPASADWFEQLVSRLPAFGDAAAIVLPPLRDRVVDIWPLAHHFLERVAPGATMDADAREPLERHRWPGNVAELRHVVALAALRRGPGAVRASHLSLPTPSDGRP